MKTLIVTNPFDGHEVGAEIAEGVDAILAGEHAHDVVAVEAPDAARAKKPSSKE